MVNDWIRTLTIIGEGRSVDDALDLIAKVNQPGKAFLQTRTPLPPDDARVLHEVLAWLHEVRSRQAGVNLLVEQVLTQWLVEATGRVGARSCSGWRRRSTRRCHPNSRRDL